jgi:uncharacterized membrane protein
MKRSALTLAMAILLGTSAWAQTSYSFKNVKYPHDTFTQLLGINDHNEIAGYHGATVNKGFTYDFSSRKFTNENFPGSAQTQVIAINNSEETGGFYVDQSGVVHGFLDDSGSFKTVDLPGTPFNQILGRNVVEQAVGYYSETADGTGRDHAYIYDENGGVFEVLTIPGEVNGAQATSINHNGQVTGFFVDANMVNHGFLLYQGTFTQLDYPNAIFTQALGVNNLGRLVGAYQDASGNMHGFIYDIKGATFQSIDNPAGIGSTVVNGINDDGTLVGFFGASPINTGFVATPKAQ